MPQEMLIRGMRSVPATRGARVPAAAGAQRDFGTATVVLSFGRLLTTSEMTFFDRAAPAVRVESLWWRRLAW